MEWVEGFRLTDGESLEKYGLNRKKLVDTLVQCSLRQILGNGKYDFGSYPSAQVYLGVLLTLCLFWISCVT